MVNDRVQTWGVPIYRTWFPFYIISFIIPSTRDHMYGLLIIVSMVYIWSHVYSFSHLNRHNGLWKPLLYLSQSTAYFFGSLRACTDFLILQTFSQDLLTLRFIKWLESELLITDVLNMGLFQIMSSPQRLRSRFWSVTEVEKLTRGG